MTPELFKTKMEVIQKYYNNTISPEILSVYWEALKKIDDKEWIEVVDKLFSGEFKPTMKCPFPLIFDFKKHTRRHILGETGAFYLYQ